MALQALVLIAREDNCSLSMAFGLLCEAEAAKCGGRLPFSVLHVGKAAKFHMAASAEENTGALARTLAGSSRRWNSQLARIGQAAENGRGGAEGSSVSASVNPPR